MTTLEKIEAYIQDDNVLCVYRFGSRVYGTANDRSDHDFIVVAVDWFDSADINIHVYTDEQFLSALARNEIQSMECAFLSADHTLKECIVLQVAIDKTKLRTSISTIVSNSWVKGKKKLIIAGDYDVNLAIKSVFHSLRILDFGTQIAQHGAIVNYGSMNWVLADLVKMSETLQRDDLWNAIDTKYRSTFNKMNVAFKQLCPKDLNEKNMKVQLEDIVKIYQESYDPQMISDILQLFTK